MTINEAIYCMESYLPDNEIEHCLNCPYYGYKHTKDQTYVCNSSEAHRIAIKALRQLINDCGIEEE